MGGEATSPYTAVYVSDKNRQTHWQYPALLSLWLVQSGFVGVGILKQSLCFSLVYHYGLVCFGGAIHNTADIYWSLWLGGTCDAGGRMYNK